MRELVARGALCAPVHVESFYGYNLAGPFGSAMMGDASHWVHRLPGKLVHNNLDHILYKLPEILPDDRTDAATTAILKAAKTGKIGDGKIFVTSISESIRIRTEENSEKAL